MTSKLAVNVGFFRSKRKTRSEIELLVKDLRKNAKHGLNIGCGASRLPNLTNCDFYDESADLKTDATDLSMFETASVDYIESNHMIEHLSITSVRLALSEWGRVLRPKGILVVTCPEFREIAWKWWAYSVFAPSIRAEQKLRNMQEMIVGSQENEGMFHKSVFDKRTLPNLIEQYGFRVTFVYSRYPLRTTPSMIVIAERV